MKQQTMRVATVGLTSLAALAIAGGVAGAATPSAARSAAPQTTTTTLKVYQAKKVNQDIVLGPQSAPSTLTKTAALPAGTYLVTSIVGAVIASHDQIVCATNISGGNDGVFGTAGNPGTGGIYGTATMTDTVKVTAGQSISVTCNSFNYGLGTYAGDAVIEAVPVGSVSASS